MKVKVIAYTKFIGVPSELIPENWDPFTNDSKHNQDEGTDAERLIECAGRTCYDSYGKGRGSKEYHQHIKEVGHGSILEHSYLSFFITGVSRGLTHELVRHRIGVAISQRSTRYVDESESDWQWHPLIEEYLSDGHDDVNNASRKDLVSLKDKAKEVYIDIVSAIQDWLMSRGIDKVTARKQARGAARGALGNALSTELVWTTNIRNLRNVLEQRASEFADAEIRLLANALYEAAYPFCPEYLNDYEKVGCPDGIGYGLVTKHRKI